MFSVSKQGGGQERRQDRPLRIAQVSVIASGCHALQMGTAPFSRRPLAQGLSANGRRYGVLGLP